MLIAIDYDHTYTADPEGWGAVVALLTARGHTFVCVTGRRPNDPVPDLGMPVVYAGDRLKARAAALAGYAPEIWIDDMPGTIEPVRVLEWDDCASDAERDLAMRAAVSEARRRHPWFAQPDGRQNPHEFLWLLQDGNSAVRLASSDESLQREYAARLSARTPATEDPSGD